MSRLRRIPASRDTSSHSRTVAEPDETERLSPGGSYWIESLALVHRDALKHASPTPAQSNQGVTTTGTDQPGIDHFSSPDLAPPIIKTGGGGRAYRFVTLQKFIGTVTAVTEETFFADVEDLTEEGPDEEVEIGLEEVPDSDQPLIRPGAAFYWSIGYQDRRSGQRTRASTLWFRRVPRWEAWELQASSERVEELARKLSWDEDDHSL